MTSSFQPIGTQCVWNATSTGLGDFVVASAFGGGLTPAQMQPVDGYVYKYYAQSADGSQWESGNGTYHVGTATLSRTTIITSSNSDNSQVNFTVVPIVSMVPAPSNVLNPVPAFSNAGLLAYNFYNSTQTITIPASCTKALIKMWGGAGGSGGAKGNSGEAATGGTGAPGYLEKFLSGLTPGNTLNFTVGAAGTAGASTPTDGGAGGNSTLASGTQTISTLTANGSSGSAHATAGAGTIATSAGSAAGTASGGDFMPTMPAGFAATGSQDADGTLFVDPGGPGVLALASGVSGVSSTATAVAGNAGKVGGLIIEWFS